MLQFYYHPLSPIARRVWLALLEKEMSFEPILVDLRGQQHEPEYLALNPFHHVPVLVDHNVQLIESLAILDYLEAQYPSGLWPKTAVAQATARMIQMVTVNELMPHTRALIMADLTPVPPETSAQLQTVCTFYDQHLSQRSYFGGESLNLADIVVGATIPLCERLGLSLAAYPQLQQWHQRITARPAWQTTHPSDRDFTTWRRYIQRLVRAHQKHNP